MCFVDIYKCTHGDNMPKIDKCYEQPTNMADAGTKDTGKPDCVSPSKFTRNQDTVAHEHHDVKENRDMQLGSNAGMSNGFDPEARSYENIVPLRGFNNKK